MWPTEQYLKWGGAERYNIDTCRYTFMHVHTTYSRMVWVCKFAIMHDNDMYSVYTFSKREDLKVNTQLCDLHAIK